MSVLLRYTKHWISQGEKLIRKIYWPMTDVIPVVEFFIYDVLKIRVMMKKKYVPRETYLGEKPSFL